VIAFRCFALEDFIYPSDDTAGPVFQCLLMTICLEEIATARHLKARDVMTKPVVTVVDQTPVDFSPR
jgi:hypothetical protein